MSKKSKTKGNFTLQPLNDTQKKYINAIKTKELIIADGPAGTGKTFIPAVMAAQMYNERLVSKIVITRPNIPSGRSIGFFPGELQDKMAPWIAPIMKTLEDVLQKGAIETGIKNGNIEIVPFEVMRGRDFSYSFVILDEAQNTSYEEMKMFVTRQGKNSKVVITGDVDQTDLLEHNETGLESIMRLAKTYNIPSCETIEFTEEDVVRSGICKAWTMAYRRDG